MIDVAKTHELLSKEHNGDYIPVSIIKEKFELGLDSINIAPEFGLIETQTYLDYINENRPELLDQYWKICFDSGKWKKWVNEDFDPYKNKVELIKICGHYVISYNNFLGLKAEFPYIDEEIKIRIKSKLHELFR